MCDSTVCPYCGRNWNKSRGETWQNECHVISSTSKLRLPECDTNSLLSITWKVWLQRNKSVLVELQVIATPRKRTTLQFAKNTRLMTVSPYGQERTNQNARVYFETSLPYNRRFSLFYSSVGSDDVFWWIRRGWDGRYKFHRYHRVHATNTPAKVEGSLGKMSPVQSPQDPYPTCIISYRYRRRTNC